MSGAGVAKTSQSIHQLLRHEGVDKTTKDCNIIPGLIDQLQYILVCDAYIYIIIY